MISRQNQESFANDRAEHFLDQLYGYQRRQGWGKTDREFVIKVFNEWDEAITDFTYRIKSLELRVKEAENLNRYYERRLIGKGLGSYIKFILGISECPSQ